MPNRCDECLLCNDYGNYIECKKAERQLLTYDKPDWCPLKPLPNEITKENSLAYVKGFHDAIVSEVDD